MSNPTTITAQPGLPFIDMVREYDAPRELVFRAYTDPELVVQWLGPRRLVMELGNYDARDGGSWSYVHRDDDGTAYSFRGVFHSVQEPERIIQTFEFAGAPGQVSIETMTFEDLGNGRTRCSAHAVYPSVEARDGMAASGMESGVNEGNERLDELLARLAGEEPALDRRTDDGAPGESGTSLS
ncbi:SRPBCC domain-containing protein [Arthrobacter sp. H41]|uniref:SRPBCC domain-containing protein n=1 Tax=Arthrobacter sp. H41 TaxID=1312978 RepID=UPI0004B097A5